MQDLLDEWLVEAPDGSFLGTTQFGGPKGAAGSGTVFRMDATGGVGLVHAFERQSQGARPMGGVTVTAPGVIVGTTRDGGDAPGAAGGGVLWRIVARRK
jgi:uncharacterized repeat protein (TIGR03803 family)